MSLEYFEIPRAVLLGPPAGLVDGVAAALVAALDEDGAHEVEHDPHGEHVQQRLLDHVTGEGKMAISLPESELNY